MSLVLRIANRGEGKVDPNPLVGAVIVKNGKIIGKGYHQYFGGPHAEINAINSVRNPAQLKGATLYINLEPCVHFGKTPPCTPAIIQSGIKKVVIASQDPNPLVSGKGIRMLRHAGIKVELLKDTIAKEAEQMNAPFFKYHKTGLPYVIAKWAMTADGKLATVTGDSKWISSEQSRALVQKIRSRVNGILVGINTVLKDNPMLIPHSALRTPHSVSPARIIVDSKARTPLNSQIAQTAKPIPTYIAVSTSAPHKKLQSLMKKGCMIIKTAVRNRVDLKNLLKQLAGLNISKILVEGGGMILGSLFAAGLVDEVYIFIAPKIIGGSLSGSELLPPIVGRNSLHFNSRTIGGSGAVTPVAGPGIKLMRNAINLKGVTVKRIGPDMLIHGNI